MVGKKSAGAEAGGIKADRSVDGGIDEPRSSQLNLNATVYNLLDQNFVEYAPYVSNTTTGAISYTNLYSNNQEPRRLWLSLGYTF